MLKVAAFGSLLFLAIVIAPSATAQINYKELEDFAQSICGDIPEGNLTKTTIQGKVAANAGLLTKLLSGVAEADVTRQQETYRGIPFDKLPDRIPTVAMCKSELIKVILAKKVTVINRCRLPDFGQEGWNREETVSNSSGRVGGGHDQGWWCNQVATSFITSRQIGPQNTWQTVSSGEESNKDTWGHVTYKYSCTIKVSWDPRYFEKQDPRCGVTEQ